MKWKPDRPSMLWGMLMGICLGICFAMLASPLHALHQIGRGDDLTVALALGTLEKLATNGVAAAEGRLTRFVASTYLDHKTESRSWLVRTAYVNPDLIQRVEKTAQRMPDLQKAIAAEKERRSTNKAPEATR